MTATSAPKRESEADKGGDLEMDHEVKPDDQPRGG
jgi:hypothetical protein